MSEISPAVVVSTSIVALLSGFALGVYSVRGWLVRSPELAAQRHANFNDPVESSESDVDEDETLLDHAPNWANGEEADRRQGLRASAAPSRPQLLDNPDQDEECKLVLVVRTDLGMTKGKSFPLPNLTFSPPLYKSSSLTRHFQKNQARSQRSAGTQPWRATRPSRGRRRPTLGARRRGRCGSGSGTGRPRSRCRSRAKTS